MSFRRLGGYGVLLPVLFCFITAAHLPCTAFYTSTSRPGIAIAKSWSRTGSYSNWKSQCRAASNDIISPPSSKLHHSKRRNATNWHIWKTADHLERAGLSVAPPQMQSSTSTVFTNDNVQLATLIRRVVAILRQWGHQWSGQKEWQGFLNKPSLLQEVEESIVALYFLQTWIQTRAADPEPVTLVDVACGKGVFSMLALYLFQANDSERSPSMISGIIMLDNQLSLNWDHVHIVNQLAAKEQRPPAGIETWPGCNLHQLDNVIDRLLNSTSGQPVVLVGIHLCRTLSPTMIGLANALGPSKCPFLCLVPCCLPRIALSSKKIQKSQPMDDAHPANSSLTDQASRSLLEIRRYESPQARSERMEAWKRRHLSKQRKPSVCYLCNSKDHAIYHCDLLPSEKTEQLEIFRQATEHRPCWNCGLVGHQKADCPEPQAVTVPRPPICKLDVSSVFSNAAEPTTCSFETYCGLLATALQRNHVRVVDSGLVNPNHSKLPTNRDNWNGGRKSIYIVAH